MTEQSLPDESIFLQALEIESTSDRLAFVEQACGPDQQLRADVDALLRASAKSGDLLALPDAVSPICGPLSERVGSVIGPYRLLEQIGEGGMGLVYMAEQQRPMQRLVALKLVKPGMDSKQVIARFEAEKQALAMMDHPNIARVFEAGTTDTGCPYFVMELVRGIAINEFCDQERLSVRERLELFIQVCQAVQHAHQKGIIHRDIKPTNVLVAKHDVLAVPKVIDFGIAKALGPPLTEHTLHTGFAQLIGTPLYMSPEQAEMNQFGVDTRSDVYSLGVLLYELLTGTTPFDKDRLKSAGFDELRRIIREEEPETVSARLARTRGEMRSAEFGMRSKGRRSFISHSALRTPHLPELDWIVAKSLEKDRSRRYESASAFAADVQRYLNDEPVQACPPSAVYRLRKFARRNQARLAAATVLGLALLVAVGTIGWAIRDRGARHEQAQRESIERQQRVTGQVQLILNEVDQLQRDEKWPEALDAARRASDLVEGSDAEVDVAVRVRTAIENLELVRLLEDIRASSAESWKERGLDSRQTADRYATAFRNAGIDLARLSSEEAAQQAQSRAAVAAAIVPALDEWGICCRFSGQEGLAQFVWDVAELLDPDPWQQRIRQARATRDAKAMQALAEDPDLANQPPAIVTRLVIYLKEMGQMDAAVDVLSRAQRQHPTDFWIHFHLAQMLASKTPPDLEQAVGCFRAALAVRSRSTAAWNSLGSALKDLNRPDEAGACYQRAIELEPKNFMAHSNLGLVWLQQGKVDDAMASFQAAIELNPQGPFLHSHLGQALARKGKVDDAIACYRKAIELNPKLAAMHDDLGVLLGRQSNWDDAIASLTTAIELNPKFAGAYRNLGAALFKQQRLDDAVAALKKAIEINPLDAVAHFNIGVVLQRQAKPNDAVASFNRAIELDRNYTVAHNGLAESLLRLKRYDEAIACYRKTIALDPKLAPAHENLGAILCDQKKDYQAAIECFRKAIALQPQRAIAHLNLGVALIHEGQESEALASYREANRLQPTYSRAIGNLSRLLSTSADPQLRNPEEALQLARKATELTPQSAESHQVLGWAHYRAGNWKACIEELQESNALQTTPPGGNHWQWFFLAMAHWQTGEKEEARRWYGQAVTSMDQLAGKDEELLRIRAEAETLLDIEQNK